MRNSTQLVLLAVTCCIGFFSPHAFAQSCEGQLLENLIPNGDFGSGFATILPADPMLAPGYLYETNPPPDDGYYVISNTTNFGNPLFCWVDSGDNSSDPNGYMMVVNASFEPGLFFEQTLEVCDGMQYQFSVDLLNILRIDCPDGISPNVDFLINGDVVFETGNLPQDETWHTYSTLLNIAPGTNSITLALRNNAPGGAGNDLAIDNISLQHCAPEIVLPPVSFACPNGILLQFDEALVSYPSPYYQWQRSFDGGVSWLDIPGAQNASYFLANPIAGIQYRVQVANGSANFQVPGCRAVSTATEIEMQQPVVVYVTPVICEGDTLVLAGQMLTQAGTYSIPIAGQSGCDSILEVTLFTNPSYEHWYFESLCYGDEFLGETYYENTTLSFEYQSVSGCDSTIFYEIQVFSPNNLSVSGDTILCAGESVLWQATPGYNSYTWSNGDSGPSVLLSEAGTYTVYVMNSQGCGVPLTQTLTLSAPFFEVSATETSCPGGQDGQIEVLYADGGIPPYLFSIDDAFSSNTLFENLTGGAYQIVQTDAWGCLFEQTVFVDELPALNFQLLGVPSDLLNIGETITLSLAPAISSEAYDIIWSGNGKATCQGCTETGWMVLGSKVQVNIIGSGGCEQVLDASLDARQRYRIYWPNAFSPNGDGQNDQFAPGLGSNVQQVIGFYIYDRWGDRLFQANDRSPTDPHLAWDGSARGKMMNPGVYLYQAEILFDDGNTRTFTGEVTLLR